MDKKAKTIKDFSTTATTPFVELNDMKWLPYVKGGKKERGYDDDGEYVKEYAGRHGSSFKDEAKFTKLFVPGSISMSELSVPGIKVLCYICNNLKINTEEILLSAEIVAESIGYKFPKNVYVGIVELIEHGFLARKTGKEQVYFVNPCKIFNGNRGGLMDNPARNEHSEELKQAFYDRSKFKIK